MSDNPIVLAVNHPLFIKRETWLKKHLQQALDQPFISFGEVISKYNIDLPGSQSLAKSGVLILTLNIARSGQ
ncbi:hypothetical protein A0256_00175 [Mucilaginibacter sp. PAMC 26640]|nr:hypothetical protein A0256_00175 [Mucilaginibacter sp. PAMC 26640]